MTTSTPDTPLRRSPWILGWWQDLLLFIATPLAVVPLVSGARLRLSAEEIAIYVAAFGAIGHHLPGMLRAYGDRELFARFRTRFIVAPLFLVATSIFFTHRAPDALAVVVLLWATWHGLAQVYGFARIYDAKTGPVPWLTARVDLWLCVAWFGAGAPRTDATAALDFIIVLLRQGGRFAYSSRSRGGPAQSRTQLVT